MSFFREYKDTSKDTITEAAEFLNRKPARQGSNQRIEESAFDDKFKRHPNHLEIMLKKVTELSPSEKEYRGEFEKRRDKANADRSAAYLKANPHIAKRREELDKKRKENVERPNPVKQGPAFGPKDNWGG
jgi:hypothetical protein